MISFITTGDLDPQSVTPPPLSSLLFPIFFPGFLPPLSWNLIESCPNTKHYPLLPRERNTSFHPPIQFLLPISFLSFPSSFRRLLIAEQCVLVFSWISSLARSLLGDRARGFIANVYRVYLRTLRSGPSQSLTSPAYIALAGSLGPRRDSPKGLQHVCRPPFLTFPLSLSLCLPCDRNKGKRILANFINARRSSRFEG